MQNYDKIDNPEILASLFMPPQEEVSKCPEFAENVEFTITDEVTIVCRFYKADKDAPTLLYFHGSKESVNKYDPIASKYVEYGVNIMLASYRGYGNSDGSPGVESMLSDSAVIFKKTAAYLQNHDFTGALFVMGRSLGSAAAVEVAHTFPEEVKGLIIESGFCNTLPLLEGLGVDVAKFELSEEDGFQNPQKIEKIKLPTMFFHGSRDTLVLPAQAETMQASSGARNKQFHIIPGAEHGTMIESGGNLYFQTIKTFLDTVCGVNNWRKKRKKYSDTK